MSFQRLVYGGRELKDAELFTAVNITDGVTVHLFLRTNQPAAEPEPGVSSRSICTRLLASPLTRAAV